jgi:HKD family nuclease
VARVGHNDGVKVRMLFQPFKDDLCLYRVLQLALADDRFMNLTIVVAWAKESGLRRIRPLLSAFRGRGGTARIILGIDEGGASIEGLRSAIGDFNQATILHDTAGTFHPKLYIIGGETASVIVVGSGNMTRGGLFGNYEAGVCLDLDLTQDEDIQVHKEVTRYTQRLLEDSTSLPLTEDLVQQLWDDPRYEIGTEASPMRKANPLNQPGGPPSVFGASKFAKHQDPAASSAAKPQQSGGSVGGGNAAAGAGASDIDKRGETAWRHKRFIEEHGSMTRADSVKIRREIYGLGRKGVQRTVVLFNGHNSILWMEHQIAGKLNDNDIVGLTDEGVRIAELWQASQTTADT